MKERLLKLFFIIAVVFIFSFFSTSEARQGCCSYHEGVCGCGCCDGTSLSATCAPYYPQCNKPIKQYIPPVEPPTSQKTISYPISDSNAIQELNNLGASSQTSKNDEFALYGFGILVVFAGIVYYFSKRKK
jgi:hypothetical protein